MFPQRQNYLSRLAKSPLLKLFDIYDKESFIREYILDNVFVCIFMYILFYFAVWYAHKVIRRIEKRNLEMLAIVEKNRLKMDDVIALKNKRAEYEDIVIKVKGAQKTTTKQLDNEMKRLNSELVHTMSKLKELEKFLGKVTDGISGDFGKVVLSDRRRIARLSKVSLTKESKAGRTHSKTSRYSSRLSHHRRHRNRHRVSSESLHDHPQHQPHVLYLRKSDSSNIASAETSSTESSYQVPKSLLKYQMGQGDRKKASWKRGLPKPPNALISMQKLAAEYYKVNPPFTKSVSNFIPNF